MVVNVLSLFFTGELVNKISELVAKLDWEKVKEAISEIPGAIWEDFTGKWNSPNKTDAAEFRGKVIGYIIAEVVLAILTAGIFTEVKWVSFVLNKLGKAGEEILMLINKAREVIGKEARATKYADELKRLKRNRIIKGLPEFRAKIPNDVTSKIPSNFIEKPNKKNVGFRWQDPNNRNNSIRIDKGDPASPFTSQRVDHVVVNSNGKVIGRNGMPINNNKIQDDPINAHIPLSEYKKWKSWNTQN